MSCNYNNYKYCIVPGCINTTAKTPKKRFLSVPGNELRRKAWLDAVKTKTKYSNKASIFVCEDHFNLEEDAENWLKVILGASKKFRLKNTVVPHTFQCQPWRSNARLVKGQPAGIKKARKSLARPHKTVLKGPSTNIDQDPLLIVTPTEEELLDFPSPEVSIVNTYEKHEQQQSDAPKQPVDIIPQKNIGKEASCESSNKCAYQYLHNIQASCEEQKEAGYNEGDSAINNAQNLPISKQSVEDRSKGVTSVLSLRSKWIKCQHSPKGKFKTVGASSIKLPNNQPAQNENIENFSMCTEESSSSLYKPSTDASRGNEQGHVKKLSVIQQAHLEKVKIDPMYYIGVPAEYYYLIPILAECVVADVLDVLICLQKIRLNQSFKGLAYDYGVSESFCSKVFDKVIPIVADCLSTLILWPDRLTIKRRPPLYFYARYHDVQSIIGCFDIEIETPSNPINQSLSWANDKKCNTLRYSISCSPDGLINHVSGGFGGRSSGAKIIESCGYLDAVPDGVSVMADRGFKGVSARHHSKLVRAPSISSMELSSREKVGPSKRVASLRMHVEGITRRIREFSFLKPHASINHSLCKYTDCVVKIVCGLVNLQKPLIKKFAGKSS